jgi:hypothetical protein
LPEAEVLVVIAPLPARLSDPAVIVVEPPAPIPAVVLAIWAPPCTVRVFARTVTAPPGPDCAPVAEAAIWVPETPIPSSASGPGVVTATEPPAPLPAVVLAISAPLVTVICGEVTVTEPALPLAVEFAEAMIPLLEPASVRAP